MRKNDYPKELICNLEHRFLAKIQILPNGCWYWTASKFQTGYGRIQFNNKSTRTHRISLFLFDNFDLDSPLCVCHRCDYPSCVNPNHLFTGTNSDNTRDAYSKNRMNGAFGKGESHPNTHLTLQDVLWIKEHHNKFKQKDIAKLFNTGQQTISRIVNGQRWGHVKLQPQAK